MSDLMDRFVTACQTANPEAAVLGYPPFTTGLRTETPLNSAPYLFGPAQFRRTFGTSVARLAILDSCERALEHLGRGGVVWRMLLVGGSFVRATAHPSDLDGLVVYTIDPDRAAEAQACLAGFRERMRGKPIDLMFCPADADPVLLVKRVIFFSNLFSYDRAQEALVHGTVMVIPRKAGGEGEAPCR